MLVELNPSIANLMVGGRLVALGVDEVAAVEAEGRAVGEHLVEVSMREAGRLLGLVLRVDDGRDVSRRAVPHQVWLHRHVAGFVEMPAVLRPCSGPPAP